MKKNIIISLIIVLIFLIIATPFAVILGIGFSQPRFSETYYGELALMYEKLTETEGKKIVVIGNSAVAFGIDSSLIQEELEADGYDYTVCNFGLYGSIGTKVMLELSEDYIGEGDIVLFVPEYDVQSLSLYFSAMDMLYAAESKFSMVWKLSSDEQASVAGNFAKFASEKYSYIKTGSKASSGTVYSRDSFDENCDLKNAERGANKMYGGYDSNNPVTFSDIEIGDDFYTFVNEYYAVIAERGAEMYYVPSPVNSSSVTDSENIDGFYDMLKENLNFSVLSDPHSYVYEAGWFYDSNFHLNESGMVMNSLNLTGDLKNILGSSTANMTEIPAMPELSYEIEEGEGDNSDAEYFNYELTSDGYYKIVSLTQEGAERTELTIPYSYNGITVVEFDAEAFNNNTVIESVTVQDNIKVLYDGSFYGCTSLRKLILKQDDPEELSVGYSLLSGTNNCRIYVGESALSAYLYDYYWAHYGDYYEAYR